MYNITQTVVTTAFCRFLRKKLRPRAISASTLPSSSLPSYFRQKNHVRPLRVPTHAIFRARTNPRSFIAHDTIIADVRLSEIVFFFFPLDRRDPRKANESHRAGQ